MQCAASWRDTVKTLITALTLGVLFGLPAFAQPANAAAPIDDARMKAVQECSAVANKDQQPTWGIQQHDRACVAQHGQQE